MRHSLVIRNDETKQIQKERLSKAKVINQLYNIHPRKISTHHPEEMLGQR
jgi:hypothetical protein